MVWIVDERRVIVCSDHLVGLPLFKTCEVIGTWPSSQTPRHHCRSALTPRFWERDTPDKMSDTADKSGGP